MPGQQPVENVISPRPPKDHFAWHEKLLMRVILAGLVGIGVVASWLGLAFPLHYCQRCRHDECALNRAGTTDLPNP